MRQFLQALGALSLLLSLIPTLICAKRPEATKHHAAYICWILLFSGAAAWVTIYAVAGAYGGALWALMNR